MINGIKPKAIKQCPFRMGSDILNTCMMQNCAWYDEERGQCVIWNIAEGKKNG